MSEGVAPATCGAEIGIGGDCGGCDAVVTVSELLGMDLLGGDAVP